jgi:nucleotide sugar dehydrogenase
MDNTMCNTIDNTNCNTTNNNITVIGIGKLGLGFALLLEKNGFNVIGVDVNENHVNNLNTKKYFSFEPKYNELLQNSTNFYATTSLKEGIQFSDIIFIIVQTPNCGGERFYDHTILSNLLIEINKLKPSNKNIIIGCTIMPKYINEVGIELIKDCENCHLSYNPEFVAQGDIINGFEKPDIILVGSNNQELKPILKNIYSKITIVNPDIKFLFLSPLDAEIVKISINSFITTKIAFANIISDLCDVMGADKQHVLYAVGSDSRIGNKYFKPGFSFGGPCFPRDTKAMKQLLDQNYIHSRLLESTTLSNLDHVEFQTQQMLYSNLDEYVIENVCYKENSIVPIIEESAKLKIAKNLHNYGKKVIIKDTPEIILEVKKEFGNIFSYIEK